MLEHQAQSLYAALPAACSDTAVNYYGKDKSLNVSYNMLLFHAHTDVPLTYTHVNSPLTYTLICSQRFRHCNAHAHAYAH